MVTVTGTNDITHYAQKMKSSIKEFFRECDQIRSFLRIWPNLLKKSLGENFIFCAVVFVCTVVKTLMVKKHDCYYYIDAQ